MILAPDFERLRGILDGLEGRFIVSINDSREVRELFAGFEMEDVSLSYRVSGAVTPARELIIWGAMKDHRIDPDLEAAEHILEEARMALENHGVRVRVLFSGGPADPIGIDIKGELAILKIADGEFLEIRTRCVTGWQELPD